MRPISLEYRLLLAVLNVLLLLGSAAAPKLLVQAQQPLYNTAFLTDEQLENY